jgi:hypothetical protein
MLYYYVLRCTVRTGTWHSVLLNLNDQPTSEFVRPVRKEQETQGTWAWRWRVIESLVVELQDVKVICFGS